MSAFGFTQSKNFQVWINRLYGWGASLVLLGALFKLQYWPGAGIMLSIGMITECVIFFISAFEPLEKKYEWESVFPVLGGDMDSEPEPRTYAAAPQQTQASQQQVNVDINIDKAQTDKLKAGLDKLGTTIDQLTGLAAVAEASARLTENLDRANHSVKSVSGSADKLSESYITTAANVGHINDQVKQGIEVMKAGHAGYKEQMGFLSKSLSAVNASFELQLQDNEQYRQTYSHLNKEVNALTETVKKSVDQTQQLSNDMAVLNNNVAKLNTVYGSMLTAVTSVLNK